MNINLSRLAICGILFLFTLISGVVLSHLGKPYGVLIFTIHKLIAVGTIIVIGVNIYRLYKAADPRAVYIANMTITGLLFLALIITGALLSIEDPAAQAILRVHQIVPLLALAASTISLYLLTSSKA